MNIKTCQKIFFGVLVFLISGAGCVGRQVRSYGGVTTCENIYDKISAYNEELEQYVTPEAKFTNTPEGSGRVPPNWDRSRYTKEGQAIIDKKFILFRTKCTYTEDGHEETSLFRSLVHKRLLSSVLSDYC